MIKLYDAANLQEAYLLAGLLRHEGINPRILNENAQGGAGEIPFAHAYPQLWIDEVELAQARAVIERYEHGPATRHSVFCRHCSEENPGHFQLCWRCGESLEEKDHQ